MMSRRKVDTSESSKAEKEREQLRWEICTFNPYYESIESLCRNVMWIRLLYRHRKRRIWARKNILLNISALLCYCFFLYVGYFRFDELSKQNLDHSIALRNNFTPFHIYKASFCAISMIKLFHENFYPHSMKKRDGREEGLFFIM